MEPHRTPCEHAKPRPAARTATGRPGSRFLRGTPPHGRRRSWPLLFAGTAALLLLTASALVGDNGLSAWRRLQREKISAAEEVDSLRAHREALASRIETLRSGHAALERIAREKYGMHREGEEIIEILGEEHLAEGLAAPLAPGAPVSPDGRPAGVGRQRPHFKPAYPPPPEPQTGPGPGGAP